MIVPDKPRTLQRRSNGDTTKEPIMIQPLHTQLSSAKPRTGLQSIGDLIPRLIRQYEMAAELTDQRELEAKRKAEAMEEAAMIREAKQAWDTPLPVVAEAVKVDAVQQSFGW